MHTKKDPAATKAVKQVADGPALRVKVSATPVAKTTPFENGVATPNEQG